MDRDIEQSRTADPIAETHPSPPGPARRRRARCAPALGRLNRALPGLTLSRRREYGAFYVAMSSRTYESGAAKRKRAKSVDDLIKSQKGNVYKLFKSNTGVSINSNDELAIVAVKKEQ